MMLLCTNLGNLWVTLFHQIYKYTFPKRRYSIYNSEDPPKYHPVDMFCHKKYMVQFMVRTILNSLNPELNLRFSSGILVNCELNLWFGSGWFGFEPKFRTELFHHYPSISPGHARGYANRFKWTSVSISAIPSACFTHRQKSPQIRPQWVWAFPTILRGSLP